MDEERGEAAPMCPSADSPRMGREHHPGELWVQLPMWDSSEIVVCARLIVDARGGTCLPSVDVSDFWTGERISCKVGTPYRFPTDRLVALLWIEQEVEEACANCAPF